MKTQTTSSMLTKTIAPVRNWLNRPSLRRGLPREQQLPRTQAMWIIRGFLLIPLALACFALSQQAQAVGPDTDGAIPGSNNGEGTGVLVSLTGGIWNTGTGFEALNHLTAGNQNTATGLRALTSDTNGGFNTATGVLSLFSNTSGFYNTATGAYSLANNTATGNTATGYSALYSNTTGFGNTATGYAALYHNTGGGGFSGVFNTAIGANALLNNSTGGINTAVGHHALQNNTNGLQNTAVGSGALDHNTTGDANTALGVGAGSTNTPGDGNVYIGAGMEAFAGESNRTYIRNINTTSVSGGGTDAVTVDLASGLIGHLSSSRRYKEDIEPMDEASEALFALKPVSYRYKKEIDRTRSLDYGLIAEDVAKVDPNLAIRNGQGQIESVRYNAINAMLLNEFLKEHRKVQALEKGMTVLTAQLKEQAAQIQKVSAQIEVTKPARQVAGLSALVRPNNP